MSLTRKRKAKYIIPEKKEGPKLPIISNPDYDLAKNIHSFTMLDLDLQPVKLDKYSGHVCIIIIVASKAKGFASHNYTILNHLYDKYHHRGLRILAFPCYQFNNEEPKSNEDVKKYMHERNVKFDVFDGVKVNGTDAHPLWKYLKLSIETPNNLRVITEPFTKFLVGRNGVPFARIPPGAPQDDLIKIIVPLYSKDHGLRKKSECLVSLPPPLEEDKRPCYLGVPWHFEPGVLTLTYLGEK